MHCSLQSSSGSEGRSVRFGDRDENVFCCAIPYQRRVEIHHCSADVILRFLRIETYGAVGGGEMAREQLVPLYDDGIVKINKAAVDGVAAQLGTHQLDFMTDDCCERVL